MKITRVLNSAVRAHSCLTYRVNVDNNNSDAKYFQGLCMQYGPKWFGFRHPKICFHKIWKRNQQFALYVTNFSDE